jgi:hypothetical protein
MTLMKKMLGLICIVLPTFVFFAYLFSTSPPIEVIKGIVFGFIAVGLSIMFVMGIFILKGEI